jgi:hypothetical protein
MAQLPYVKKYTDDCGIRRRYFRGYGGALPGRLCSPEFIAAYQGYTAGGDTKIDRSATGSFGR